MEFDKDIIIINMHLIVQVNKSVKVGTTVCLKAVTDAWFLWHIFYHSLLFWPFDSDIVQKILKLLIQILKKSLSGVLGEMCYIDTDTRYLFHIYAVFVDMVAVLESEDMSRFVPLIM